jgi:hypothetical protein
MLFEMRSLETMLTLSPLSLPPTEGRGEAFLFCLL